MRSAIIRSRSIALVAALLVALGVLAPALLFPGTALADSWSQEASGGFDGNYEPARESVSCLATYNGSLYAGTSGEYLSGCQVWRYNGGGWEQVNSNGFGYPGNVEATAMIVYDNDLYVGTRIEGPPTGCQVWRYDGGGWSPVNLLGFGNLSNTAVSSMAVYGSDLYVGTANDNNGGEVRRLHNGSWSRVNDPGFGTDQNKSVSSIAVWNGHLYAGTQNATSGCHIYTSDGGGWNSVRTDGFGDTKNIAASSMAAFNGNLYVGTENGPEQSSNGCQVWSYNGTDWTQRATGGFGDSNAMSAASMAVYNNGSGDRLYVGTSTRWDNSQCAVRMYDGSDWSQVGGPGLGSFLNQGAVSMAVSYGSLFVGTINGLRDYSDDQGTGCEVLRLEGGSWNQVNANGFAWSNNYSVPSMVNYNGTIYAGTAACNGCEVWRNDGGSEWSRVAQGGFGDPDNSQAISMVVDYPNNLLYAGTYNPATGCQIFQYNGGDSWTKINSSGFGDSGNRSATSMAVFNSNLYVGTYSPQLGGCRVYRYDGFNGTEHQWKTVVGPGASIGSGFGNYWNPMASSMAVNGPNLYVGTKTWDNRGFEVWSSANGTDWTKVASDGVESSRNEEATSMATFNGDLYVGTRNWEDGCRLFRYDGSNWRRVSQGFEDSNNDRLASMEVSNSKLYIGLDQGDCGVWSSPNGEPDSWDQANSSGFGYPWNNGVPSLASRAEGLGTRLYAGVISTFAGASVQATDAAIESTSPPVAVQGDTLDVKIEASNTHFQDGVSKTVFSGEGIQVNSTAVIDETHAVANITISDTAPATPRSVNVATGPEEPDPLNPGFLVLLPGIPSIQSVNPLSGEQGRTMDVRIVGVNTHFVDGQSTATFSGDGITVQSTKVTDVTHATARIKIADGSAVGPRTVNVTTGIETPVSLNSAFSVTYGPAHAWYLAEGSTGEGFETWVLVQNPNGAGADINVTYMTPNGPVQGPATTVPPNSRMTFNVAENVAGQYEVSAMVTSNRRIVVERSMYGNNRSWGHESIGVCAPAKTWYLAEGSTGPGFETWVLVQNPNRTPANVKLTYMTPSGPVEGPSANIPANSRKTFNVAKAVPGAWEVSTKVEANKPVVAERAMYGADRAWGHDSIGVSSPGKTWFLAEGSTGPGFETWVLVQNPGDRTAKASLTFMTEGGQVEGPELTLKPGTRRTVNVAETVRNAWSVSTMVESDEPVIAERAMYGNGRVWAHDSIGAAAGARTWCLAEGSTGPGFETWILVQNPNDSEAKVSITYQGAEATYEGPSVTLPAHSRKTFNVAATVRGEWGVSTKVTSNKPVIAERAMYGSGRAWGTDSIGFPW